MATSPLRFRWFSDLQDLQDIRPELPKLSLFSPPTVCPSGSYRSELLTSTQVPIAIAKLKLSKVSPSSTIDHRLRSSNKTMIRKFATGKSLAPKSGAHSKQ